MARAGAPAYEEIGERRFASHPVRLEGRARQFGRHVPVTLAAGAINVFWLLPIALLVGVGWVDGVVGVVVAYVPLVRLAVRFRVGRRSSRVG